MGPLADIRVIEMTSTDAGKMCGMLLADMGATVLRIQDGGRSGAPALDSKFDLLLRNRSVITLDLTQPTTRALIIDLIGKADALIEDVGPDGMERLGFGPTDCIRHNERLVYARVSGWGHEGPMSGAASNDLNHIAIAGALCAIGRKGTPPTPPLNLLGDYAGGALYAAVGILAALLETGHSGKGQVVDAAIVDGVSSQMTSFYGRYAAGLMTLQHGTNPHDSGAYYYDVYQCADGGWVSVAPIEARFRNEFFHLLGISEAEIKAASLEPEVLRQMLIDRFKTRSRDEWCSLLEGTDACFAPVLTLHEAPRHAHLRARGTFIDVDGITQPAPAPRFSRTVPAPTRQTQRKTGAGALEGWMTKARIEELQAARIL